MKRKSFNSIFNLNYYILLVLLIVNFSYFLFPFLYQYKKVIFYINLFLFIIFFILNYIYRLEYNKWKSHIRKLTFNKELSPELIKEILNVKMKYRENHEIFNLFKSFLVKKNLLHKDYSDLKKVFFKMVPEYFIDEVGAKWFEKISLWISLKKNLYVMFLDIIWFTSIAEKIPEDRSLFLLNIYFDWIVEIIEQYNGNVDKFLWDWMMVVFEDKERQGADFLLKVSMEIQEFISKFQITEIWKHIKIWIWINYWTVILWTIWSKGRMEITLIWDVVNTASRLEGLTRKYDEKILFSKNIYDKIKKKRNFKIKELWNTELKGKQEKIEIYWV